MRWFGAVVLLALTASACRAQEPAGKSSPVYQNNNNIDYGPLVFRNLSGYDIDPTTVRMAGGCIGLFTEEDLSIGCSYDSGSRRQLLIRRGCTGLV